VLPGFSLDLSIVFYCSSRARAAISVQIPNNSGWMQQQVNNLHRSQHQLAQEDEGKGQGSKPRKPADPPPTILPRALKKKLNLLNAMSSRFLPFLDRYQKMLETKFPAAMNLYKIFVIGFKVRNFITQHNGSESDLM